MPVPEQKVYIGRKGQDSIEFEHERLSLPISPGEETSFTVTIVNYTIPTHVHLAVGRELKDYLSIIKDNPYVRNEERVPVVARLPKDGDGPYTGRVHVISGYGSVKGSFEVVVGGKKVERSEKRERMIERSPIVVEIPRKKIEKVKIRNKSGLRWKLSQLSIPMYLVPPAGITLTILVLLVYIFQFNPSSFTAALLTSILTVLLTFYIFNNYRSRG
ncbi:MAG TPA: hypothetical protein ENI32_07680 [Candidatus Syntrophoarchaeum butanivorans]|uniref:Uncharacterized protein n=1 Tax=Candidatus Syntropharchaeum butanivorans TaxID=1839936 RepID=A0A1F2P3H4_9EURY|nr:MAG: conserved hypothetical protein, membrane [Candidatus Syntrophoarchaeum butanivorans]RJS73147.1 MAG: hypothetical protein CW694_01315 [Candidatus Syntrophoarchaeum sp. WYZ-LMO15]HEC57731.1 hypothetical protein [Candidatus Syntrophoarchaeum butanivorans]